MDKKLVLKNVKLLFIEINDKDFGSSITIDATSDAVRADIEQYFSAEGLTPKFKEYVNKESGETTKQFSIKLASFAKIRTEDDAEYQLEEVENKLRNLKLGFGAEINVCVRSYDYNNKFGKGKSASVSAIRIVKGAEIKDDMEDLL